MVVEVVDHLEAELGRSLVVTDELGAGSILLETETEMHDSVSRCREEERREDLVH